MILCYYATSSFVLRSGIEERTKDDREPMKTERIPKEDKATQYANTLAKQPERRTTDCLRHITEQYLHDGRHRGLHYQHIQTLQNFPEKYV